MRGGPGFKELGGWGRAVLDGRQEVAEETLVLTFVHILSVT